MSQSLADLVEELRPRLGLEVRPRIYEVDKTGCRMFARAVGYTDPIFYDEGYAKSKGYRSIPAPPGFLGHRVYHDPKHPVTGEARPEVSFRRGVNGGTDIEYFDTVCAGDVLTATGRPVADVQERQGRQGPLVVVTSQYTYRRGDRVVAIVRSDLIYY